MRIEQLDSYGNTPLGLSCVYGLPDKKSDRLEVIKLLLSADANPNVCNPYTGWTCLHWAARYGEHEIIEVLLANGSKEYLPDKKGLYPIDYAGFFGFEKSVTKLMNHTLKKIREASMLDEVSWPAYLTPNKGRDGIVLTGKKNLFDNPILRFNPVFHTSILYWASTFEGIPVTAV